MPFLEWDPSFSVHVEEFDAHHKHLIRLLNDAHDNFMSRANQEATRIIIDRLIDYAQYHFTAEEGWMRANDFPGLDAHVAEHDDFWRKMFDFQKELDNGSRYLSFEVLTFLKDWLYDHILHTDNEYGKFADKLNG